MNSVWLRLSALICVQHAKYKSHEMSNITHILFFFQLFLTSLEHNIQDTSPQIQPVGESDLESPMPGHVHYRRDIDYEQLCGALFRPETVWA